MQRKTIQKNDSMEQLLCPIQQKDLTGYIIPQKVAIFQIVGEQNVFVSTDGSSMVFQNIIRKDYLSYTQGFIDYVLERRLQNIEGDEYQRSGKKVYVVNYRHKVGREGSLTMTNRLATLKGMVYSNPYLIGK